jgi:S-methylmethionine-dependent homocysteine/selenocysteine methylase
MRSKSFLFSRDHYLTDGGLETTLVFHKGITLNYFAAFELLLSKEGRKALEDYYKPYLQLAEKFQTGFIAESPTWRANADWGVKLGYNHDELFALNRQSIKFMQELIHPYSSSLPQVIVSGNIGPRGDGYKAENQMTARQAQAYHMEQVKAFAQADADVVTAMTITYSEEAIGIIQAAKSFEIPVVISFTVETDGTLPGGESLQQAIESTDNETAQYAEHFMINCAHPEHFRHSLQTEEAWKKRIRGIRANASCKSHAELDESESLDPGDKGLLADGYVQLDELLPQLKVIGGCCGTDHSHLEEICQGMKMRFPEQDNPSRLNLLLN